MGIAARAGCPTANPEDARSTAIELSMALSEQRFSDRALESVSAPRRSFSDPPPAETTRAQFPLTPALSPRERENLRQRVRKPSVSGMLGRRSARPPLPKGEGRGEGERGHRTVAADPNTSGTIQTEPQILVTLGEDAGAELLGDTRQAVDMLAGANPDRLAGSGYNKRAT